MYTEEDLRPLSALQHLIFCERRAALVHLEGVWVENVATLEGGHLHKKAHEAGHESRADLRISRDVSLRSLRLGLSGKADIVEFNRTPNDSDDPTSCTLENVPGRWQPFPVEYKRGKLRNEAGYSIQLCAQALCLEEMLNCQIPMGAIFYGKTRRRLEIAFNEKLRSATEKASIRLHELIASKVTPQANKEPKCDGCSLLSYCMPKITSDKHSAKGYVEKLFSNFNSSSEDDF